MRPNIILLSFIMAVSAFSFETGTGKTDSRCRVAQSPSDIYVRDTVIRDLKEEQEDKEREAEELRRQAEELYSQLLSKSKYIAEVSKNIEENKDEIEVLEAYVSAAEEEINDIEKRLDKQKKLMSEIIRMMYEEGYGDSVLLVFFRDDEYGLINRSEYVRAVNLYLNNNLSDMKELLREKKKKNDNLIQLKNNREGIQQSLLEEQEELKAGLQELEDLIRETELEADDAEALAEALQLQVIEEEERRKAQAMMNSRRYTYAEIVDSDGTDYYQAAPYIYTDDELKLLAAIIEAEAGNVCYEGMIAVGSVVMNRVDSPDFPDTIAGVIYAPYQFEPAETGSLAIILAKNPTNLSYMAAEEVLNGTRNVPNLYFKAKWYAEENGISGVNIGGNVFH